jgi:hypothetical protein
MTNMNVSADGRALLSDMIDAAQGALTENWSSIGPFVEFECTHIRDSLAMIVTMKSQGKLDEDQARLQLDVQKENLLSLLLTLKGVRKIQAENAVNAIMKIVISAANRLLGMSL